MRTTVDIDPDVLAAARALARRRNTSIGQVLSQLARQALTGGPPTAPEAATSFFGFRPFPARGTVVDNDTIDSLRDQEGA